MGARPPIQLLQLKLLALGDDTDDDDDPFSWPLIARCYLARLADDPLFLAGQDESMSIQRRF